MVIETLLKDGIQAAAMVQVWREQLISNTANNSGFCGSSPDERQRFFDWFSSLELNKQEQIIRSSFGAIIEEPGGGLVYEKEIEFLKRFLFRYKMRPLTQEVFNKIEPDDIIEVYDDQGIQIYRSWNFFKFCRYTIDQVLTKTWDELYVRPEFVEKKLFSLLPKIFQEKEPLIDYHITEYIISERFLQPSYNYLFKMKFACPLEDPNSGRVTGFISVGRAKRIEN